jgi:hypothetical protein
MKVNTKEKPGSSAYAMMEYDALCRVLDDLLETIPAADIFRAFIERVKAKEVRDDIRSE